MSAQDQPPQPNQLTTLHYPVVHLEGSRAANFDKWVNVALNQGLTQTGHYTYDAKKKTVEALNLLFEGPYNLVFSLRAALQHR